MDLTFISIHDLTSEARILYSSDSVVDVLGYTPDELVNHSCWEFFPQDELPYAREFHKRGIQMDKAAMLSYCRVKNKDGQWVGCECCFTIVYDVMIVCTSIYRDGKASQKRAEEAPVIRRLFSSSPRDPRYHMLSHISDKFRRPTKSLSNEPRAALFLNRFTRTLTIMYATDGLEDVIGIPADAMRGRSFYYCIAENCLQDAVKCLETAKSNDSIAYLRFWFRDPRIDDPPAQSTTTEDSDEEMTTEESVDLESTGGVGLTDEPVRTSPESADSNALNVDGNMEVDQENGYNSRTTSGDSIPASETHHAIFGDALTAESSTSSLPLSPGTERSRSVRSGEFRHEPIELEAVISCASDGLVVCVRRARPMVPQTRPAQSGYANGLFAAPWATEPILPPLDARSRMGGHSSFAPSLGPNGAHRDHIRVGGPDQSDFMNSIRDQAIFAWALTGINGSLQTFGAGKPLGESLPVDGLPIWESDPASNGFYRSDSGSGCVDGAAKSGYGVQTDAYSDSNFSASNNNNMNIGVIDNNNNFGVGNNNDNNFGINNNTHFGVNSSSNFGVNSTFDGHNNVNTKGTSSDGVDGQHY